MHEWIQYEGFRKLLDREWDKLMRKQSDFCAEEDGYYPQLVIPAAHNN